MDSLLHTVAINLKNKFTVLELGCGSDDLINAIAGRFGSLNKIVAVDFFNWPENLNKKVEFIKQDIVVPNRYGFNNEARVYWPEHGKHYFLWDKESLEYSLNRIGFACRFYNLYTAASHNVLLKYLPVLLRLENPNLACVAMIDQ